jgi:hypothetical protein
MREVGEEYRADSEIGQPHNHYRTLVRGEITMELLYFVFWILIGLMIGPIFHAGHGDE